MCVLYGLSLHRNDLENSGDYAVIVRYSSSQSKNYFERKRASCKFGAHKKRMAKVMEKQYEFVSTTCTHRGCAINMHWQYISLQCSIYICCRTHSPLSAPLHSALPSALFNFYALSMLIRSLCDFVFLGAIFCRFYCHCCYCRCCCCCFFIIVFRFFFVCISCNKPANDKLIA